MLQVFPFHRILFTNFWLSKSAVVYFYHENKFNNNMETSQKIPLITINGVVMCFNNKGQYIVHYN